MYWIWSCFVKCWYFCCLLLLKIYMHFAKMWRTWINEEIIAFKYLTVLLILNYFKINLLQKCKIFMTFTHLAKFVKLSPISMLCLVKKKSISLILKVLSLICQNFVFCFIWRIQESSLQRCKFKNTIEFFKSSKNKTRLSWKVTLAQSVEG